LSITAKSVYEDLVSCEDVVREYVFEIRWDHDVKTMNMTEMYKHADRVSGHLRL
jgi:hypothetical protein